MTDAGRDLWQEQPTFPIRYFVKVKPDGETLAFSRAHNQPLDAASVLRGDAGPVVEFLGGACVRAADVVAIDPVDEMTFQNFVESGVAGGAGDESDTSSRGWLAQCSTEELRDLADTYEKIPQNAGRARTLEENVQLAAVCAEIARRGAATS